jgi:transcriptional regulator with XRE-family HTH domain
MLIREACGQAIRSHRTSQQIGMRQLAGIAGISYSFLSEVERGKKEISSEKLEDLCVAMGVSVPALLQGCAKMIYQSTQRVG